MSVSPGNFTETPRRAAQVTRVFVPRFSRRGIAAANQFAGRLSVAGRAARHAWQAATHQPIGRHDIWRLGAGAGVVLVLGVVLSALSPALPVSTPGVVLLVAVAFATWLADWAGGITALILSSIILDILFLGDRRHMSLPKDAVEAAGFLVTVGSGVALIYIIERIKAESADSRRQALAARAAAHALTSMEQTPLASNGNSAADRARLARTVVNAMVRVNRVHAGALYLFDPETGELAREAAYGFSDEEETGRSRIRFGEGFVGKVALERRPLSISDLAHPDFERGEFGETALGSVLGVPLMGAGDDVLGVAVIGLLVRHRFTATEIARVEALAARAAFLLEAVEVADERAQQLERARAAERSLSLVMAAMPEAVVIVAPPDGRVVGFNSAAVDLLGPLDDVNQPDGFALRLRWPEDHAGERPELPHISALRDGDVADSVELVAERPDGVRTPVLVSAAPIREPDGSVAAVVTVFRDIAELKEAARLKDEFVSVVSHELRSPLTPIRGFVQLVARELAREGGHDTHVHWLSSIESHVDRMTRLIDDLLDVSGLRAGSLEIRPVETDLVGICRNVIQLRSATAPTHELVLIPGPAAIVGQWDPDRLHQIIDNLVSNAIKYSPEGGTVTIATTVDPVAGEARLTVTDEGPGIPAPDRDHVFGAFYRTRDATDSQAAGLGLGLYICRELAQAHGGSIEVGDAAGGGAAFTVRLPLPAEAVAA